MDDRIEQEILIQASVDRVTRPGWWVPGDDDMRTAWPQELVSLRARA